MIDHLRMRIYVLRGERTVLVWCRDRENTWKSELRGGQAPEKISGGSLLLEDLAPRAEVKRIRAYDPWINQWTVLPGEKKVSLPTFFRSIVLRIELRS